MSKQNRNQGEGNREAARRYNKQARQTIRNIDVGKKAEEARRAIEGDEAAELKKAEEFGKSKARS